VSEFMSLVSLHDALPICFLRGVVSSSHCSGVLGMRMYYPRNRSEVELEYSHVKRKFNNPIVRLFGCLLILSGIVLLFSRWLHVKDRKSTRLHSSHQIISY